MNGRNAIITGGLGLGFAIAKASPAGGNVAIVARRADQLAAAGPSSRPRQGQGRRHPADISTADGCERAFKAAEQGLGQVDILVNNAGTSQPGRSCEITDEIWQHDLDLKLFAAIRLAAWHGRAWRSEVGPHHQRAEHRRQGAAGRGAPTAVTRAAGMALTKVLANGARRTTSWSTRCWSG